MPYHKPVTSPKGGRPYVDLKPEELDQVERMAGYLNKAQIANVLGISENTFLRICRENESVDAAYKKGKASQVEKVAESLFKNAVDKNNVLAQIFFLKARGGWQEAVPEQERQTININIQPTTGRREIEVRASEVRSGALDHDPE